MHAARFSVQPLLISGLPNVVTHSASFAEAVRALVSDPFQRLFSHPHTKLFRHFQCALKWKVFFTVCPCSAIKKSLDLHQFDNI